MTDTPKELSAWRLKRMKRINGELLAHIEIIAGLGDLIQEADAEVVRLREGLMKYASPKFWHYRHPELDETAAQLDYGSEARRILGLTEQDFYETTEKEND